MICPWGFWLEQQWIWNLYEWNEMNEISFHWMKWNFIWHQRTSCLWLTSRVSELYWMLLEIYLVRNISWIYLHITWLNSSCDKFHAHFNHLWFMFFTDMFESLSAKYCWTIPSDKVLWYYFFIMTPNKLLFDILTFLLHTVPAYIVDFLAVCLGKKPL